VKPAIRGHFIPAKKGHFKPALTLGHLLSKQDIYGVEANCMVLL